MNKDEYLDAISAVDEENVCPSCGGYADGGSTMHCVNVFCPSMSD
jgi:hypothetical protein